MMLDPQTRHFAQAIEILYDSLTKPALATKVEVEGQMPNYDPTDAQSMIRFLAEAEWVRKSLPDFEGDPPGSIGTQSMEAPFKALRVPCPNIGKGANIATFWHSCPCKGRLWVPEPDVRAACWEIAKMRVNMGMHLQPLTEEGLLLATCRWVEHQMEVKP